MQNRAQILTDELLRSVMRALHPLMSDSLCREYEQRLDWLLPVIPNDQCCKMGHLTRWKLRVRHKLLRLIQEPIKANVYQRIEAGLCSYSQNGNPGGQTVVLVPYDVLQPISGGAVRVHEVARQLGGMGDVTVVCLGLYADKVSLNRLAPGVRLIRVPAGRGFIDRNIKLRETFGATAPLICAARYYALCEELQFVLSGLVPQTKRVVMVGPYFLPMVRELFPGVPVFYDAHDVNADYARMICGFADPEDLQRVMDAVAVLEQDACDAATHVWCVSERDMVRLRELYNVAQEKVVLLENGVDTTKAVFVDFRMTQELKKLVKWERPVAVFIGSNHHPNRQAALLICRNIAPRFPEYLFAVIGMQWSECISEEDDTPSLPVNVQFLGKLDNLNKEAVMALADVALVPMSQGCGASLKIPDCAAHGKSIIASPHAIRGYEAAEPWMTISPLSSFETALTAFSVRSMEDRLKPSRTFYNWVTHHLDWRHTCRKALQLMNNL